MKITQRQFGIGLLVLLLIGVAVVMLIQAITGAVATNLLLTAVAFVVLGGVLYAYWRDWRFAPQTVVVLLSMLVLAQNEPFITQTITLSIVVVPIIALILANPPWVIGSAVAILGGLIIRAGGTGVYTDPLTIVLYAMIIGGMVIARLITDTARQEAEENAAQARAALAKSEAQANELSQQAGELSEQNAQQRRLLDLVATLETPAVALADGVILAPVVGHLDSRRASDLTTRLLNAVSTQRTRLVILDIAGVPTVDTAVAQALLRAIQAVGLLGCEVTLTGISASVAATMTQLGINMAGVRTARTPQEAMSAKMADGRPMAIMTKN